jgi:hydroxyacylglutathione hydrolase
MLFKQIYDDSLAQASYLIGCQKTGEAIVIDPRRDIGVYLEEARNNGLTIIAVTETHIHADYLSGARELAAATKANLYLSDEGGTDWAYQFAHTGLKHAQIIKIGNIALQAIHTPGHTPEHLSFLITDGATTSSAGFFVTGDFVFVGDLGRPDLLDEAAGGFDTRFEDAKQLFTSLQDHFLTLPDYVQVWAGHGAGSACGKALGAVASSTVGYERRFAWWSTYLENNDLDGFTRELLEGQPDAPSYFARMKRQNKAGPTVLGTRDSLVELSAEQTKTQLEAGAWLIDTRSKPDFQDGAVKGSLHLPAGKNFTTWAAWLIDPEFEARDLILLAQSAAQAAQLQAELTRVGIDRLVGFITNPNGFNLESQAPISLSEAQRIQHPFVLDVRAKSEFLAGHIPGATQIHAGQLYKHLQELPHDLPILLHCQSGTRSAAATSYLRAKGFSNVLELDGGFKAWQQAQLVGA